jgi:hypothetical protein
MASVRMASPIYIEEGELRGGSKGLPRYEHRINFPNPWPGGWWHLRDIVDYELAITDGLLDCCAKHSERFLYNFYLMGKRAIKKGKSEPPYAFVIPTEQRDPVTAARMIESLMLGGIEVHEAKEDFESGGRIYRAGSYVARCDQPYRAYLKDLLEVQDYPDIRASKKEPFVRPYDVTGWTLPFQMGVSCEQLDEPLQVELKLLTRFPYPDGAIADAAWGYALDPAVNASYSAVSALLAEGFDVSRVDDDGALPAGSFVIPMRGGLRDACDEYAEKTHAMFIPLQEEPAQPSRKLKPVKVALFKPWRANMDEGWTRLLFDTNNIEYANMSNEDIKKGSFKKYDVLVIPDIQPSIIKHGKRTGERAYYDRPLPTEYQGGIDKEGVKEIREYVEKGGTLICFDSSCDFAIETFELPVKNVTKGVKSDAFYCPGSILKARFRTGHPITYGMPENGYLYFANSPAFSTTIPFGRLGRTVLASYKDKDPKASGLLIGGERLYRRAALVEMTFDKGKIVLFGFRPQHRCQSAGTFKLIFNAILEAGSGGS